MPRKQDRDIFEWPDTLGIQFLFCPTIMLGVLANFDEQLKFYREFYDKKDSQTLPIEFLKGYQFAILALLDTMFNALARELDLVGLRSDDKIYRLYTTSYGIRDFTSKVNWRCSAALLFRNLLTLYTAVLFFCYSSPFFMVGLNAAVTYPRGVDPSLKTVEPKGPLVQEVRSNRWP